MGKQVIGSVMMAYNESEFIKPAILSVLPFVNQLIIGEGATIITHKITGSWRSQDRTIEVINKIKKHDDPNGKIYLLSANWTDKCHIQNACIKKLNPKTNRLLVHGGDEVYKAEDFKTILKFDDDHPRMICIRYPFIHFWHDLNHIAVGEPWKRTQLRYSVFNNKVCEFKVHYGIGDNNCVRFDSGDNCYTKQGRTYHINKPRIYHYGHAKSRKNQINKFLFYSIRDHKWDGDIDIMKEKVKKKSGWWNWKGETGGKSGVELFKGTHPKVMHDHPRYIKEVLKRK